MSRCTRALSGALLLAATACAPAGTPSPPAPAERIPAALELSAGEIRAIAELLHMEDRRQLDAERHAALLRHPAAIVRSRAALAAGRVPGVATAPLLLPLLADSVAEVRADAAFALGLARDTTPATIQALASLVRRSAAAPPTVAAPGDDASPVEAPIVDAPAIEAIAALGRIGGAAARRAILELLQLDPIATQDDRVAERAAAAGGDPAAVDTRLAGEAALASWRFERDDALVDALIRLSGAPDPELRWRATYALVRLAPPRAAAALRARLIDEHALTRSLAARALRAPLVDSARLGGVAAVLEETLRDADPHVRINAARALASYGDAAATPLARLLADPDSNVVLAATEALAAVGAAAVGTLRGIAANRAARPAIRAAALGALVRDAFADAEPILEEWRRSDDWRVRLYAARALASGSWETAGPRAIEFARDDDARVAAAAFAVLAGMLPAGAGRAVLTEGIAAADPLVRAAALRGIQRQVQPQDLAILLEAYAAAQRDAQADAALAAIDALAALAEQNVPVQRAFYARFAAPADPIVRRHAAARITPSPWHAGMDGTGRTPAFYEAVVRGYIAAPLAGAPLPRVILEGPHGDIVLELDGVHAPLTVHNFITLVEGAFFAPRDGAELRWHRVVPNFVLQDGDPRGDGAGGPGYAIRDELNRLRYGRGVLGMALSGPDTGGSQWFITHSPQPHLDGGYTIFGRVAAGMDAADRVLQDDAIHALRIERPPSIGGTGSP